MPAFIDLTGERFGRLLPQAYYVNAKKKTIWRCICDCGKATEVAASNLRSGHTQSCGCLVKEFMDKQHAENRTHGMAGTPLYARWATMLARCYRPTDAKYPRYGGRGITMCDRWRESFAAFYADMGDPPKGMQIERRDNNGPYDPENCYWATATEQANNRRGTKMLTWQGITQCLETWAHVRGINPNTVRTRLSRGWDIERALTTPGNLGNLPVERR